MLLQVSPLPYGEEEEEAAEAWKEEKTWLSGLPLPSHHAASCILHPKVWGRRVHLAGSFLVMAADGDVDACCRPQPVDCNHGKQPDRGEEPGLRIQASCDSKEQSRCMDVFVSASASSAPPGPPAGPLEILIA
ncbi:hypothetical protein HL42_0763 [Trichophyton rubrum]|nr:hypothetical protein HL42_0763 [Trichophyton rubrum]